jgi:hypothetical protein
MLKNAYLQEAIAQRRQLLAASLRPSKRVVKRPQFNISVRIPEPPLKMADLPSSSHHDHLATKTPGSNPSPIEGVPERVSSGRMQLVNGHQSDGFSPLEGLGELRQHIHPVAAALIDGKPVGGRAQSPVEGLVHHAVARGTSPAPVPLADEFKFDTAPAGDAQPAADGAHADDGDEDLGGGFDDDGWGGGWGADDGFEHDDAAAGQHNEAAMPPPPSVPAAKPKAPRRQVMNPGIRLRNQLPRRSLAMNPRVGRQEVIDANSGMAVRRSMRVVEKPLKYWLNEDKQYTRKDHVTMPTIQMVVKKFAKTPGPWRMVSDPIGYRQDGTKRKAKGRKRRTTKVPSADRHEKRLSGELVSSDDSASDEETVDIHQRPDVDVEPGEQVEMEAASGREAHGSGVRPIDLTVSPDMRGTDDAVSLQDEDSEKEQGGDEDGPPPEDSREAKQKESDEGDG